MTEGFFECDKCGFTKNIHISEFVQKCPNCGSEYELLAIAIDLHIAHTMPFYILKGTPVSKAHTNGFIAFASSGKKPTYNCYNKEFCDFLNQNYGDKLNARMVQ